MLVTEINKYHLELKDWVDNVFHGYARESVNSEDINKIKKILEEFIAETDDYILKDYLEYRTREYKNGIKFQNFLNFNKCI